MNTPEIKIFTDGSCNPTYNIGTWAAILLCGDKKFVITGESLHTTHQRMELLAVIEAITFADEKLENHPLDIYTDSQYVVRLIDRKDKLTKNQFITKKGNLLNNSDLIERLIHQIETHKLNFVKVKAHQKSKPEGTNYSDISIVNFNIEVDKLARKTLRETIYRKHSQL